MQYFFDTRDIQDLIKEATCFKGINPTCINLILTHQKNYRIFITGTSNCNAFTTSILKLSYVKDNPKIKLYRDHQNFDNDLFKVNLENGLRNLTDSTYTKFLETLDYHAPIKKKNL